MSRLVILLTAFLIGSTAAVAQDKPTNPATIETERPKTEVERLLEQSQERGEIVLAQCIQDCGEQAVDGDVETGRVLELPKPRYPAIARAAHASGQVLVRLIIDVDGTVIAAAAVSGHPLFYGVSVAAAKDARFTPTKVNGKPVKVTGVITYNFASQ